MARSKTVRINLELLHAARDSLADFLAKNKDSDVDLEVTESFIIHFALKKLIEFSSCRLFPAATVSKIVNAEKLKTAQALLETLKKSGHVSEDLQVFDDEKRGLCLTTLLASEDRSPIPEAVN